MVNLHDKKILEALEGDASALMVAVAIASFVGKSNKCFPSVSDIQKRCKLSRPTVIRKKKLLIKKGIIRISFYDEYNSDSLYLNTKFIKKFNGKNIEYEDAETSKNSLLGGKNFLLPTSKNSLLRLVKNFNGTSKKFLLKVLTNEVLTNEVLTTLKKGEEILEKQDQEEPKGEQNEETIYQENSIPLKPQKSTERKKVAPKKESPFFDEQKMSEEFKTFLRLFTDEYGGHASSTAYAWNYFKTSCTNSAMDWRKEVFKLVQAIKKLIKWRVRAKAHNERNYANQVQIPKPCGTNRYFDERRWQVENHPLIGNEKPKPKPQEKKASYESKEQKIAYIEKLIELKMISNDRFSIELKRINGNVTTEQYNTESERLKAAKLWEIKRPNK